MSEAIISCETQAQAQAADMSAVGFQSILNARTHTHAHAHIQAFEVSYRTR